MCVECHKVRLNYFYINIRYVNLVIPNLEGTVNLALLNNSESLWSQAIVLVWEVFILILIWIMKEQNLNVKIVIIVVSVVLMHILVILVILSCIELVLNLECLADVKMDFTITALMNYVNFVIIVAKPVIMRLIVYNVMIKCIE